MKTNNNSDEQIIQMLTPKVEVKPSADLRSRILAAAEQQKCTEQVKPRRMYIFNTVRGVYPTNWYFYPESLRSLPIRRIRTTGPRRMTDAEKHAITAVVRWRWLSTRPHTPTCKCQ